MTPSYDSMLTGKNLILHSTFFQETAGLLISFRGIAKNLYFCNICHPILLHVLLKAANDHLCLPNHIALWLGKVESLHVLQGYDETWFRFLFLSIYLFVKVKHTLLIFTV